MVSQLRSAKKSFVDTIPTGNTKEFWKAIKLLNGKGSQTIPVINHDGRQLVSDQQKADALNYFFHSCFNTTLPPLSEEGNSVLDPDACPEELYCSEQEVYELLTNLDHKKASGPDGISARMLKGTATSIAPVLTMLFNCSIQTGKLPSAWKVSNIVPIPKGSSSDEPCNYRPISLLSIISKVLERIIYNRVTAHLECIYPPIQNQWGFLSGRSTTSAILSATHDWFTLLEEGKEISAVFFDLTKAFDSVPHRQLIAKLEAIGLNVYLINWIKNYLTHRTQTVVLNGASSQPLPVLSGVPQGSVLGPLLFLLYINDICDIGISNGSKLVLYADDILLYRAIDSPDDFALLQHDVNTLDAWSSIKLLKFNPSKCKTMFISRRRLRRSEPSPLFLNGSLIEAVDCIKYLGVSIASDLSWSQHIQSITSKTRRLVGLLFRQYYHYADTNVLKKLYVSLVRPHLEYAVPIWDPYTAKDCDLVESVQRFAGRVCLKSWDIGYPEILNSLNLPSLETRRKVQKLILLYKFVNNLALFPEAPLIFHTVNYPYSTRNVHDLSFCNLHGHTLQYLHSYFPDTIKLWNTLPYNIVSCKSLGAFKHALYAHFKYNVN